MWDIGVGLQPNLIKKLSFNKDNEIVEGGEER